MESSIRVFGERARDIEEGDRFVARVTSVEGRKVVILECSQGSVRDEAL